MQSIFLEMYYSTTSYEYDKMDRIVRVVDHNGNPVTIEEVDSKGTKTTNYSYDAISLHKYLYAAANPVAYTDPSGNMFTLAEAAVTVGSQAMQAMKEVWESLTAVRMINAVMKAQMVCTVVSVSIQIKGIYESSSAGKYGETTYKSFVALFTLFTGFLDLKLKDWIIYLKDGVAILIDLINLSADIVAEDWKAFRWDLLSLVVDILSLILDAAKIKIDEKMKKEWDDYRKSLKRNHRQNQIIDIAKFFVENDDVTDDIVDLCLYYAKACDCFDDVWIVLFHSP